MFSVPADLKWIGAKLEVLLSLHVKFKVYWRTRLKWARFKRMFYMWWFFLFLYVMLDWLKMSEDWSLASLNRYRWIDASWWIGSGCESSSQHFPLKRNRRAELYGRIFAAIPYTQHCNFDCLLGSRWGVCYQVLRTFHFFRHLNKSFESLTEISTLGAAGLCQASMSI